MALVVVVDDRFQTTSFPVFDGDLIGSDVTCKVRVAGLPASGVLGRFGTDESTYWLEVLVPGALEVDGRAGSVVDLYDGCTITLPGSSTQLRFSSDNATVQSLPSDRMRPAVAGVDATVELPRGAQRAENDSSAQPAPLLSFANSEAPGAMSGTRQGDHAPDIRQVSAVSNRGRPPTLPATEIVAVRGKTNHITEQTNRNLSHSEYVDEKSAAVLHDGRTRIEEPLPSNSLRTDSEQDGARFSQRKRSAATQPPALVPEANRSTHHQATEQLSVPQSELPESQAPTSHLGMRHYVLFVIVGIVGAFIVSLTSSLLTIRLSGAGIGVAPATGILRLTGSPSLSEVVLRFPAPSELGLPSGASIVVTATTPSTIRGLPANVPIALHASAKGHQPIGLELSLKPGETLEQYLEFRIRLDVAGPGDIQAEPKQEHPRAIDGSGSTNNGRLAQVTKTIAKPVSKPAEVEEPEPRKTEAQPKQVEAKIEKETRPNKNAQVTGPEVQAQIYSDLPRIPIRIDKVSQGKLPFKGAVIAGTREFSVYDPEKEQWVTFSIEVPNKDVRMLIDLSNGVVTMNGERRQIATSR